MKKTFTTAMAFSFLLIVTQPGFAGDPEPASHPQELRIAVRLYNYAQVPSPVLVRAEQQAAEVLRKAGLEAQWLNCQAADGQPTSACEHSLRASELVLRIVRRNKAARKIFGPTTTGFAVRFEDGSGGTYASVFYDRVEVVAGSSFPLDLVLGLAMAHELGHLLLPTGEHYPTGLMRADFRPKDLRRAENGWLEFTSAQAEQLRSGLLTRVTKGSTAPDSAL